MESMVANTLAAAALRPAQPEPSPQVLAAEVDEVVEDLRRRHPTISPQAVAATVSDTIEALQPVRITRFVPVLAERAVGEQLTRRERNDAASAPARSDVGGRSHRGSVVVGFDGSQPSRSALEWALGEADRRGVSCSVVEARPEDRGHGDPATGEDRTEGSELSTQVDGVCRQAGFDRPADVRLEMGSPEEVLAREAGDAGLLVVGSRGHRALEKLLLGSVSDGVIDRRPCPVVVVPAGAAVRGRDRRIVVGVDGSAVAARALCWAADEAQLAGATMVVVHAWHSPLIVGSLYLPTVPIDARQLRRGAQECLDRSLRLVPAAAPATESLLVEGDAADALRTAAETADLLVVGSSSHGKFAATLLGSTSRACVHHAPCPVAVIP